ncbi:MAG: NAD-dependent epimerase/dehydratase family protein [Ilumatobacteraceae bacterium]
MKVLVTGATSLIGEHTVAALEARGDSVTTLQRGRSDLGSRQVSGSICDDAVVAEACDGLEGVIHLAARVGVLGDRAAFEAVNVDGTRILIDAARSAGVTSFVQVSSPSVAHAGTPLVGAPAGPADPGRTRGHYATTKAQAELAALAASSVAMPIVAIRPHLVWGPGDRQLIGRIIDRAMQHRLFLVGSGTALIDTTYVVNAAEALVAALDRAAALAGRALVVTNGEPRTVHELVARITEAAGIDCSPRRVPTPVAVAGGVIAERVWGLVGSAHDPPMTRFLAEQLSTAHWFDQRETRAALEWAPRVSLAEGFELLRRSFEHDDPA